MGTRSITWILEEHGKTPLCKLYRQMDGYPEEPGHGRDLYDIIMPRQIVYGIRLGETTYENAANGMDCLATTIIRELKKDIGGVYLCPVQPRVSLVKQANDADAEYAYTVWLSFEFPTLAPHGMPCIRVDEVRSRYLKPLYSGTAAGMAKRFDYDLTPKQVPVQPVQGAGASLATSRVLRLPAVQHVV